jgi:Family of unknown function (DUF6459)
VIRTAVDSRPPALSWLPLDQAELPAPGLGQPSLLDDDPGATLRPQPTGHRYLLGAGPGALAPAAGLPDPAQWTAVLALAIGQTLSGSRPAGQLERWLDEPVLADIRCLLHARRRLRRLRTATEDARSSARIPAISVASVHAQCPTPTVVEASAHLRLGPRSLAVALRLEAYGDRWLGTHLELGPLPWPGFSGTGTGLELSSRGQ